MSFKPNSFVGKWLLPSSYSFDKKASMAFYLFSSRLACGDEGVRTPDLVVANHALSQLSYIPGSISTFGLLIAAPASSVVKIRNPKSTTPIWAYLDSNQGPQLYQSCALAN